MIGLTYTVKLTFPSSQMTEHLLVGIAFEFCAQILLHSGARLCDCSTTFSRCMHPQSTGIDWFELECTMLAMHTRTSRASCEESSRATHGERAERVEAKGAGVAAACESRQMVNRRNGEMRVEKWMQRASLASGLAAGERGTGKLKSAGRRICEGGQLQCCHEKLTQYQNSVRFG